MGVDANLVKQPFGQVFVQALAAFLRTIAPSIEEPTELYMNAVQGLWMTGVCRKSRIQFMLEAGMVSMPHPMHSTSRTVSCWRFSLGLAEIPPERYR